MRKYTKTALLLIISLIVLMSIFAFSGCRKDKDADDESGIIVVTEDIFNQKVSSPIGDISRFSVKELSKHDEKYLVEGRVYYVLAFLKDANAHKMTVNLTGASIIDDTFFVTEREGSDYLKITKETNTYTSAVDALLIENSAHKKKSDYYVAVGFSLYEGFGEEINISVDAYFEAGGVYNWDNGARCQKQTAYEKHVKTESSTNFISEADYKSGDIDSKLKNTLSMKVGERYYAVIDYKLYEPVGITETDRASIRINVRDPDAVWENGVLITNNFSFGIEEFPTRDVTSDKTGIDATFFLNFSEEGIAKYRFIVLINPYDTVKVNIDAKLGGDKISFVLGSSTEGSISTGEEDVTTRSLEYQLSPDKRYYTVVGLGSETRDRVTVPESYNGLPVKEIADNTFSGVRYLKEVKLSQGLEKIGKNAFGGCAGLEFIVIPSSVTSISENAFNDCNLDIFYVGTSIPTGWENGFNPENLIIYTDCKKSRGSFNFLLNSDGISYTVSGGNCNGERIIIPAVYGDYPVTHVAAGLRNFTGITLPESIVSVAENALKNTDNLTYASISASARAFINTDKLKWLEIKGKTVPSNAFKGCTELLSLTLSNGVTEIGDGAFYGCAGLTSATLGSSVQSIGNSAFYGCKKLSSLNLPDSVTSVGDYAFSGCSSLPSVEIGNNVTTLGKYAFEYCSSVKEISIGTGISAIPEGAFRYTTSLNFYTVPDHIVTIDKHAFYGCHGLVSVDISSVGLSSIGEKAFYGCNSLIEVVQEYNYVTKGSTDNGYLGYYAAHVGSSTLIEKQGDYLFYKYQQDIYHNPVRYLVKYAGAGGNISLPESYEGYGYKVYPYAFYDIDTVGDVTVKGKVTEIGAYAFYDCDKISEIEVSGDVINIGERAFYSCDILFRAEIDGSVEAISASAFEGCKELYTLRLGGGVEVISNRAFYGCTNLYKIHYGSSYNDSNGLLYSSVDYIGISAFEGCAKLNGVIELPGDVTVISERAFAGCTAITEIKLGALVENVGTGAFDGCTSLENITVSEYNTDYMSEDGVLYCIKNGKELVKYPEGKK